MAHKADYARPVRVSIPASVAANIDGLKKTMGSVLDKLGCPACCSGHDIYLELQRDVVFGRDLKTRSIASAPAWQVARPHKHSVSAGLSAAVANNIDDVYAAIDKIAEMSGHTACATGCDIFFNLEELFTLDENFNVDVGALRVG